VLATGSNDPNAITVGAKAFFRQGDFEETRRLAAHASGLDRGIEEARRLCEFADWALLGQGEPVPGNWAADDSKAVANSLCAADRVRDAVAVLRPAAEKDPSREDIAMALSHVLLAVGDLNGAFDAVDAALAVNPIDPHGLMQKAAMHLTRGELATGWGHYENRFRYWRRDTPQRMFSVPRWQGQPAPGQRLMIWREEGIGDEIRFASCIPELAALGFDRVIFECAPRLVELFQGSFDGIEVRAEITDPEDVDYDLHLPLFSLPGLLRPSLQDFPDRRNYLQAGPDRRDAIRENLAALGPGPRIGICWRSLNASWRKMPFHSMIEDWQPILSVPGMTFINLQVEPAPDELAFARDVSGAEIHDVPGLDLKDDIDGVAALMTELDAVVSSRCWVPILSGALGVKTYCFTAPFSPFFVGQPRDPWMSMVEVFYDDRENHWAVAMNEIAARLTQDTAGG